MILVQKNGSCYIFKMRKFKCSMCEEFKSDVLSPRGWCEDCETEYITTMESYFEAERKAGAAPEQLSLALTPRPTSQRPERADGELETGNIVESV